MHDMSSQHYNIGESAPPRGYIDIPTRKDQQLISKIYVIIYGTILSVGILFNLMISVLILTLRKLRNAQNMFVLNLCVADMMLGMNAMFVFVEEVDEEWTGESWLCQFLGFTTFVAPFVVVLTMVVIAKNRHTCIVHYAQSPRYTKKRVWCYLAVIWTVAALAAAPILFGFLTVTSGFFCLCCFYFNENLVYGVVVNVLLYLLPNAAIASFYAHIFCHVRRSRQRIEHHRNVHSQHQRARKDEVRLAVQFILLFLIFNCCFVPTMVVFWVEADDRVSYHTRGLVMILFALNIIANPTAYFLFNRAARRELAAGCCCCRPAKVDISNDTEVGHSPASGSGLVGGLVEALPAYSTAALAASPKALQIHSIPRRFPEQTTGAATIHPGVVMTSHPADAAPGGEDQLSASVPPPVVASDQDLLSVPPPPTNRKSSHKRRSRKSRKAPEQPQAHAGTQEQAAGAEDAERLSLRSYSSERTNSSSWEEGTHVAHGGGAGQTV